MRCPTLLLWSTRHDLPDLYGDPLAVGRPWVDDLTGASIESGHHMAEDNPAALSKAYSTFSAMVDRDTAGLAHLFAPSRAGEYAAVGLPYRDSR